jgi:hypothetical protein
VELRTGARLTSAVCSAEAIVIRAPSAPVNLTCGGVPMLSSVESRPEGLTPKEGFDTGSELGKRYADDERGLELLCCKAGRGALAVDDKLLQVKRAKPLPSSD